MQVKTYFQMKEWALALALKKRPTVIRKWPILEGTKDPPERNENESSCWDTKINRVLLSWKHWENFFNNALWWFNWLSIRLYCGRSRVHNLGRSNNQGFPPWKEWTLCSLAITWYNKSPNWRPNGALGHVKPRKLQICWLCLTCSTPSFALQFCEFVTHDRSAAKGPLSRENDYKIWYQTSW